MFDEAFLSVDQLPGVLYKETLKDDIIPTMSPSFSRKEDNTQRDSISARRET